MAFDNTREALKAYDAGKPARDAMALKAESDADVVAWQAAEEEALDNVRLAFYEDTKYINSKSNCMIADIGFMHKCAVDFAGITNQESEEFKLYLKSCTDSQVLGVLEKERAAGRMPYILHAESEARGRRLSIEPSAAIERLPVESKKFRF